MSKELIENIKQAYELATSDSCEDGDADEAWGYIEYEMSSLSKEKKEEIYMSIPALRAMEEDEPVEVEVHEAEREYYERMARADKIGLRLFPHSQELQEQWEEAVKEAGDGIIDMAAMLDSNFYLLRGEGSFELAEEEFSPLPELVELNLGVMAADGGDTILVPLAIEKQFVLCASCNTKEEALKVRFAHYHYWANKFGTSEVLEDLMEELRLHKRKIEEALFSLKRADTLEGVEAAYLRYSNSFLSSLKALDRIESYSSSEFWLWDASVVADAKEEAASLHEDIRALPQKVKELYLTARQAVSF